MNQKGARDSQVSRDIARAVAAFSDHRLARYKPLQFSDIRTAETTRMTSWGPQMKR